MFKKSRSLLTVSVALGIAVALVACSGPSRSDGDASRGEASVLDVAVHAQPPSLDPFLSSNSAITIDVMRNVFEPLVAVDLDGEVHGVLAESYEVNEDYTEFTFTLRGVKFHDGSPLGAQDVVASFNKWVETNTNGSLFGGFEVEAVDDRTVVLRSAEPFFTALDLLADTAKGLLVLPAPVIEASTDAGITEFIGTGPYAYVEWIADQYVLLKKHGSYEGPEVTATGAAGARTPVYDEIKYHFGADDSTRLNGLRSGEYDIVSSIPADMVGQVDSDPAFAVHTVEGAMSVFYFNKSEGNLTSDVHLRKAVAAAIDHDAVMTAAFSSSDYYTTDGALGLPDSKWYTNAGLDEYNVADEDLVKEHLAQSNYNGEPLRLITTQDIVYLYQMAVVLEQQLENVGIDVQLEVYDWPTASSIMNDPAGAYELAMTAHNFGAIPAGYPFLTGVGTGFTDPAVFAPTIAEITGATSEGAAKAAAERLQEKFYEYQPAVKIGNQASTFISSSDVEGFFAPVGAGSAGIVYNATPAP